jgi:CTD small phosphatase-like protein 2
MDTKRF